MPYTTTLSLDASLTRQLLSTHGRHHELPKRLEKQHALALNIASIPVWLDPVTSCPE